MNKQQEQFYIELQKLLSKYKVEIYHGDGEVTVKFNEPKDFHHFFYLNAKENKESRV